MSSKESASFIFSLTGGKLVPLPPVSYANAFIIRYIDWLTSGLANLQRKLR